MQQLTLLEAMRDPAFYPHRPDAVVVVETHISTVFLAGPLVYKVKKPIVFPFVDYRTLESRRHFCLEEVRLNAALAPAVYLGVRAIIADDGGWSLTSANAPGPVEYAVEMRRIDDRQQLHHMLANGAVTEGQIDQIARRISEFHRDCPSCPAGLAGAGTQTQDHNENFDTVSPFIGLALEKWQLLAMRHFVDQFLNCRHDLFRQRARDGFVRDGHGDLRCEHIVLENTEVLIFDRIEFSPALRCCDVAADLAFLVMDLEASGRRDLAQRLVTSYRRETGDPNLGELLPFYASYRAWVRGKVECLRSSELEHGSADHQAAISKAAKYFTLAQSFAWRARSPAILVLCGVAASGKSLAGAALSAVSGLPHCDSDVIRKRLAKESTNQNQHLYSPEMTLLTYIKLAHQAQAAIDDIGGVIVEATFLTRDLRDTFLSALPEELRSRALFCEFTAPKKVLYERAAQRRGDQTNRSDADLAVIELQLGTFEPLDEVPGTQHLIVDANRPIDTILLDLEAAADRLI